MADTLDIDQLYAAAYLTQWLDDLIVCRVDTRACEVVNSGPSSLVLPEVG